MLTPHAQQLAIKFNWFKLMGHKAVAAFFWKMLKEELAKP
jgi:hypothetical protein